ncbi:MAG: hotdog fold thioesterase [Crocinitomicaceae bacterium]|nr:hotdog fold thioesterase [Crocinitomicaceae bacterium]
MNNMSPVEIVNHMLNNDAFSQWMKVKVLLVELGKCELSCKIHKDMLNGHNIAHGGITYSLSDSALAFAANTYGAKCVSIETSISHILSVQKGDKLHISCKEVYRGKTVGIYSVKITNQSDQLVSNFKGTVSISSKKW